MFCPARVSQVSPGPRVIASSELWTIKTLMTGPGRPRGLVGDEAIRTLMLMPVGSSQMLEEPSVCVVGGMSSAYFLDTVM